MSGLALGHRLPKGTSVIRVCFQLQIAPGLIDEYVRRHSPVWAEMRAELEASGRRNYSLFLGDDGLLVGYYETDDDDAARAYLAASPVVAQWDVEMARFFIDLPGRTDRTAVLGEVFHLEGRSRAAQGLSGD